MELYSVLLAVALVASFVFLCISGRKVARFFYLTCKIPGPSLWQVATVHAKHLVGEGMVTYVWKLSASYNFKPWGFWMTDGSYVIVVSDCETLSEVYRNKNTAEKSKVLYTQLEKLLGRTLMTMSGGREYAQNRKVFGTGLRKCSQEWFLEKLHEPMREFVREIRDKAGREVDIRSLVDPHVASTATVSFTSAPPDNLSGLVQTFVHYVHERMDLLRIEAMNPIYYWLFVRHKPSSKQLLAIAETFMSSLDHVLMNEKSRSLVEDDAEGIVQTIVQSYLKTMQQGSDKEISQIGRALVLASIETTSFMVNMLFIVFALHQDVQQRVFDEVRSVLGEEERLIVAEDLDRLQYMEMVIKETLRLFPPAAMTGRKVLEDTDLNGTLAPKGSTVIINPFALHRNPEYFPDPLKFDPYRFSSETPTELRPYSYLPFSAGTRSCPGQLHANTLMKFSLCYAVRNFQVFPGEKLKSLDDVKVKVCFSLHLGETYVRFVDRFPRKV